MPSVGRYLTSKVKRKLISSTKIPWMEGTTNHDAKVENEKFSDQHQDLSSKKSAIKPIKKGFDPQKKLIALQKPGRFTNPPSPWAPSPIGLAGDHRIHAVSQIPAASGSIDEALQPDELGALEVQEDFAQEVLKKWARKGDCWDHKIGN